MSSSDDNDIKKTKNPKSNNFELKAIKPRTIILAVFGVFFIAILATVFISSRISSTLSQSSTTNNGLTVDNHDRNDTSTNQREAHPLGMQDNYLIKDAYKVQAAIISHSDFNQEAQSILFREEKPTVRASSNTVSNNFGISSEDFRAEARNTLYRDIEN